jgi:FtsP/CotA-like multicopper oxidase with cupredoxin domain
MTRPPLSRREALKRGLLGIAGAASASSIAHASAVDGAAHPDAHTLMTGGVPAGAGIDPTVFLRHFDYGVVSKRPNGQTVREYRVIAMDRDLEVMPGVFYAAWTFNGQVPGPTLRCTEGDLVRVHFHNAGRHQHSMHFHGFHAANMDGVFEQVDPGGSFVYEFEAQPFGLHLYHCHTMPLKRHIAKGLYGAMIIDPRRLRPPANEMVMVLNGFDVNFDGENEVYAANTVPFVYQANPIVLKRGELNRLYLVNVLEFDLVNSMHTHGNFFRVFRTGTSLEPSEFTDTLTLGQGERHVLEFTYDRPGKFMFHAHQSEFAELGWMGVFDVQDERPLA